MKDVLKCMGILFVGFAVAVLVYPCVHESGHFFIALCAGAEVTGYGIVPLPYVQCDISGISNVKVILIGFGGFLFPFAVSLVKIKKNFWVWYAHLVFRLITAWSFALGVVSVFLFEAGTPMPSDDVSLILELLGSTRPMTALLTCGFIILTALNLSECNIFKKYFDIFF